MTLIVNNDVFANNRLSMQLVSSTPMWCAGVHMYGFFIRIFGTRRLTYLKFAKKCRRTSWEGCNVSNGHTPRP